MKKFTKAMLISAGILSLIGIVLCAIGVLLGGSLKTFVNHSFVDLNAVVEVEESAVVEVPEEILTTGDDEEAVEKVFQEEQYEEIFRGTIEDLQDLSLVMGGGVVTFISGDRNDVRICVNSEYLNVVDLHHDDEELEVEVNRKKIKFLDETPIMTVQIPNDFCWGELDVELRAGQLIAKELIAGEGSVTIQAGKVNIKTLSATELDLDIKAGAVEVDYLEAISADITCDAGTLTINDGTIENKADITCNAGTIKAKFSGNPDDYTYELLASLGRIELNGESYTGISGTKIKGNGKGTFDVSCNVGAIELDVEESATKVETNKF